MIILDPSAELVRGGWAEIDEAGRVIAILTMGGQGWHRAIPNTAPAP